MRAELEEIALIEQYLEGKLEGQELNNFEARIAKEPALRQEVELQKVLVQRIQRQAMRELINVAHADHTAGKNSARAKKTWPYMLLGVLLLALAVGGVSWWSMQDKHQHDAVVAKEITKEVWPQNVAQAVFNVSGNSYTFLAQEGAVIEDERSGAVITIPPNVLIDQQGITVKGEVTLTYREFRDAADIAASNIPMTYKNPQGDTAYFNSAGMFEMRTFQGEEELTIREGQEVTINFPMTEELHETDYYYLNDTTQNWEFLQPISEEDRPVRKVAMPEVEMEERVSNASPVDNIELSASGTSIEDVLITGITSSQTAAVANRRLLDDERPYVLNLGNCVADTVADMKALLKMGSERARNARSGAMERPYPKKEVTFDDCFLDLQCDGDLGNSSQGDTLPDQAEIKYPVLMELVKSRSGKQGFKLSDAGGQHKELGAFRNVIWRMSADEALPELAATKQSYWRDVRIQYDGTLEFTLELKGADRFVKLPVTADHGKQVSATLQAGKDRRNFKKYEARLKFRRQAFDGPGNRKKAQWEFAEASDIQCLHDGLVLFMTLEEMYVPLADWKKGFVASAPQMEIYYDSLLQVLNQQAKPMVWLRQQIRNAEAQLKSKPQVFTEGFAQLFRPNVALGGESELALDTEDYAWTSGLAADSVAAASDAVASINTAAVDFALRRELSVRKFGIYNCDQTYRLKQRVTITPKFVDENGKTIDDGYWLCVIDKQYNNAFNYGPGSFSCSSIGRNNLLLLTHNRQAFLMNEEEYAALNIKRPGKYEMPMKNVTASMQSTEDLRRHLGFGKEAQQ